MSRFNTSRFRSVPRIKSHALTLACGLLLCAAARVPADDDGKTPRDPLPPRLVNAAEQELWNRLNEPASVNWIEHTFSEALTSLAGSTRLKIRFDDENIPKEFQLDDQRVALKLHSAPLRRILKSLFEPFTLEAVIKERELVVTTITKASDYRNDWIYDISDLLHAGITPQELAEAIANAVNAPAWERAGGKSTIRFENGELHVRQSSKTRSKLDTFLVQLRQAIANVEMPGVGKSALMRNRFYGMVDLLKPPETDFDERDDLVSEEQLIEKLQLAVLPPTWRARGGEGSMELREGRLLVRQTRAGHAALADFLQLLRARRDQEDQGLIPLRKSEFEITTSWSCELLCDPLVTRAALTRPQTFHMDGAPWPRIFRSVLKQAGLQALINREAMVELKLAENEKRSLQANEEPLSLTLDRFARSLGVDWFVDEYGFVRITTPKEAAAAREIRLHPIAGPLARGTTRAALITQIRSVITPKLWDAPDRLTSISPLGNFLVVNHNRRAQDEIEKLLKAAADK